ncbi:nitroreductase family protein [Nostoc sp. TCL26-01]|uniref:nitroreductase family protein n=1 Tax=Nostoc sp. TCL26-01 TaxID=2576904 RepID=UPI0015BCCBE6|nr:nitroreductase family protein [Nostoc sp. TCL26-01]QLE55154.1 nitroreductase [Nostoc sp. TCL26-01]
MSTITKTQPLDVPSAIVQRRSIKTFKTDPIAPDLLKQLVELTVAAPSSFNVQAWRIILVQDEAKRAALAAAAWNQKQVAEAPVTFVFAADANAGEKDLTPIFEIALENKAWNEGTVNYFKSSIPQFQAGLGDKRREYAIKDAIIASTHLVLAAESLGLSTCFMNGWIEDKVKEVIGAADEPDLAIAVLVPVGYAAEPRLNPGRLPLSHNVFVDTIHNPYPG